MLKAKIVEIKAAGAVVTLDNNKKAWLPGQELSTRYNPLLKLSDQELCSEGQELEVIEYGKELGGGYTLVSHIRVDNDPWNKVRTWQDNEVKEMRIQAVTASRAYGVIDSGVRGFVEIDNINKYIPFPRSWKHFKTISPGDIIAGYVKINEIDFQNRLVKLDPTEYLKNLKNIPDCLPVLNTDSAIIPPKEKFQTYENYQWTSNLPSEIQHLFVVDDDELFLKEMGDYLESCGIETTRASSKDEITRFLENPECQDVDAAFIDINLAKDHDYVGFQVAKAIVRIQPRCRIIMTTGDPIDREKISSVTGNLLISGFLFKPFGIEELYHTLAQALVEKPKKINDFFNFPEEIEKPEPTIEPKPRSLDALVSDFKNEVAAETVILFSIHPISYEVRVVTHFGLFPSQAEDYSSKLHYSPVKDVAIDKEIIFENKIIGTPRYSKHRWLVIALQYESCIGCPVTVTQELEYCLFAFHGNEKHFDKVDLFKLKSTADRIAQALEIQRLEETIRNENPFYLTGKTYGSMAHDLVNALNREFGLPAIFKIIADNNTIGVNDKIAIKKHLENLRGELERAKEIVKNFRRMSRSQHENETEVDVVATSQKVARIIKVETDALNTEIIVTPPQEHSGIQGKVKIKQTPFEQVLYNIFLNAAQQIDRFSFARRKGIIQVEFAVIKAEDNKDYFRVLIHDSGPGIHTRDFEKIFQRGYTTKEDGCGMGLDICRNILSQAGSRIRVLKSILFCGSTFEILLPL